VQGKKERRLPFPSLMITPSSLPSAVAPALVIHVRPSTSSIFAPASTPADEIYRLAIFALASSGRVEVRRILQSEFPVIGSGRGVFSFVHVEDAAAATMAALEGDPGVYNIVDSDPSEMRVWLPAYETWRCCKAAYHDNGKIKPDIASINAEQALLKKHSEGRHDVSRNGGWIDAGTDALGASESTASRPGLLSQVAYCCFEEYLRRSRSRSPNRW
jgi:hypothetical protein